MTAPFSTAVVEAELRWGNLDTELEARVLAATQKAAKAAQRYMDKVILAAKARVDVDRPQIIRDLKEAVNQAALSAPAAKLKLTVTAAEVRAVTERIKTLLVANTPTAKVNVAVDDASVAAVRAHIIAALAGTTARVGVDIDVAAAAALLAGLTTDRRIKVDLDMSVTPQQLSALRALNKLTDKLIRYKVDLDAPDPAILKELIRQLRQIDKLTDKHLQIKVDLDADQARLAAVLPAVRALNKLADKHVTIKIDLDVDEARLIRVAELLRTLRDRNVNVNVDQNQRGVSTSSAGDGKNLDGINKKLVAIGSLAPLAAGAIGSIGVALLALGPAAAAIGATLAVGLNGIKDAFSSLAAADESAGPDALAQAKAVESATRGVESAEKGVQRAKRDSRDAENDLTRARKDAQTQIRDLNLELRGAALSEKDAQLTLLEARRDLAKGGFKDSIEQQRAVLRVDEAEQRLTETQVKNRDLAAKTDDANAKGVEGADNVVAAKQRLEDATEAVADAQKTAADAQKALIEAQTQGSTAADKAAKALEKLSPNARAFVLSMRELKPEFAELRKSVQDNLFAGLDKSFTELATASLPTLKEGMGGVATSLNGLTKDFASFWSSAGAQQGMKDAFANASTLITGLSPGLQSLTQGILDIGTAAKPAMGELTAGLSSFVGSIGSAFSKLAADGTLTQVIAGAGQLFAGLGTFIGPVIELFAHLAAVAGPIIGELFAKLGPIITAITPALTQIAQVVGDVLLQAFDALAPVLPVIANMFATIFKALAPVITSLVDALAPVLPVIANAIGALVQAFAPLLPPLIDALAPILPVIVDLLGGLAEAFAPIITQLVTALQPILPVIIDLFKKMVPIITQIAGIFGDAFSQALEALAPLLPPLFEAFGQLVEALLPLLPPIISIALELMPTFIEIFKAVLPIITDVIKIVTDLVNYLVPILIPVIEWLGDVIGTIFGAIGDTITFAVNNVIKPIISKFGEAVSGIGGFFSGTADTVKGGWDNIVGIIKSAVATIGRLMQKIPDWVAGGSAARKLGDELVKFGTDASIQGGYKPKPGSIAARARGGLFRGRGGPTDDANLVRISDKEHIAFITNAQATKGALPLLEAINAGWVPSPDFLHMMMGGGVPGFAGGGRVPYGLAVGTDTGGYGSSGNVFPDWVHALENRFGVKASTYAGHQESSGLNKGIDWSGSVDSMQRFAEFLATIPGELEQVIWENPNTGQKIGIADGKFVGPGTDQPGYYADDWADHRNHVHTRSSLSFGGDAAAATAQDNRTEKQKIVDAIVAEGQAQGASPQDIQAAIATNLVEAEGGNPDHGPDGSKGSFQQRDLDEWTKGGTRDRMNPTDAARSFFEHYKQTDPSKTPGERAQEVQRSAYPEKYDQRMGDAAKLYEESIARGKSSSTSSSSSSTSASGDGQKVFVTNWPNSSVSGAKPSAATTPAYTPSTSASSYSPTSFDSTLPGEWAGTSPTSGMYPDFGAANNWAAQQDFAGQASSWAQDALKSITGEFTDMFGLRSLSDRGIDSAFTAARQASEIKVADTVNFYGVNDPNAIADANARMLRDRMNPVTNTYRNG